MKSIAKLSHEIGLHIAEQRDDALVEELVKLDHRWERLAADVDELLGKRPHVIEVSLEDHRALERAVQRAPSREAVL